MPKKRTYKVVAAETIEELTEMVNEMLSGGWKCQGGIAQGANEFLQAMRK